MVISILLIAALVLFILATAGVTAPPRFNWLAAGLACWVATHVIVALQR